MASPAVKSDVSSVRLRFDRFELDEADARLTCAGEPVALPNREPLLRRSSHGKDDLLADPSAHCLARACSERAIIYPLSDPGHT